MNRLSMFVLLSGLLQTPELFAAPASLGVLAVADNPVRLMRATSLYKALAGTRLQATDFIETDQSGAQIDELAGIRVGMGPHTRIYLERTGNTTHIALTSGWLKLQPVTGVKAENLSIRAATLVLDASRSASVIHAEGTQVEVFVEDGTQTLIERDDQGHEGRKTSLTQEQYVQRKGHEPLSAPGRPDSEFISAMPPAFFDPLPTIAAKKLPAVPLIKVRDVTFDDISPMLLGPLKPGTRTLATRFASRLSDPAFRQAITQRFGGTLEWETELYRFERKTRVH